MRRSILLGLVCVAPLSTANAQASDKEFAAYAALVTGTVGAYAPAAPLTSAEVGPWSLLVRYGRHGLEDDAALSNFGLRGEFDPGRGRLGISAGVGTCSGCDNMLQFGLDWFVPLVDQGVRFGLRPSGSLGFFTGDDADDGSWSLALGAPIAIPVKSGHTMVLPYLEPAYGFGGIRGEFGESGSRPMLGGGILVAGRSGRYGLQLGFQKIFIDGGELTWGVGMTVGGGVR